MQPLKRNSRLPQLGQRGWPPRRRGGARRPRRPPRRRAAHDAGRRGEEGRGARRGRRHRPAALAAAQDEQARHGARAVRYRQRQGRRGGPQPLQHAGQGAGRERRERALDGSEASSSLLRLRPLRVAVCTALRLQCSVRPLLLHGPPGSPIWGAALYTYAKPKTPRKNHLSSPLPRRAPQPTPPKKVSAFTGDAELEGALKGADLVIIPAGECLVLLCLAPLAACAVIAAVRRSPLMLLTTTTAALTTQP